MLAIASAEEFHAAVAASASSGKTLVACFSAPWCGGCKLVAPKVAELAGQLEASADFAKVSAEDLESLCEELEVDSYPHFRVYQEGKRAGDYTSSKFEKVDAFIRGFVAPETLQVEKKEETPEGDVAETEGAADEAVEEEEATDEATEEAVEAAEEAGEEEAVEEEEASSKKRQERDDMEANDEHVDKKAKTEEEAPTEEAAAEEAVEDVEETQETAEEAEEEEVAEVSAKEEEEEVADAAAEEEEETPAEKVEEEAAPVDKLEASESAEVEADAAAA